MKLYKRQRPRIRFANLITADLSPNTSDPLHNMASMSQTEGEQLQQQTNQMVDSLCGEITSVYQRWELPLAPMMTELESRLMATYSQRLIDLLWSTDQHHGEELDKTARAVSALRSRIPSDSAEVRDRLTRISDSFSWFANSRRDRHRLGVTRPPDRPSYTPSSGLEMPLYYWAGKDEGPRNGF